MARVAVTATTPTAYSSNGTNISDLAGSQTMVTGAGNGAEITWQEGDIILLDNVTGGNAVFELISPTLGLESLGGSVTDAQITVATTKKHLIKPLSALNQSGSNLIYIDCDVAAKIGLIRFGSQA
jgi:hypothetical protein|tara:strand:+ start:18 stop:392 length:375 start_codon:yes stop_codon:yes gene_type:complete